MHRSLPQSGGARVEDVVRGDLSAALAAAGPRARADPREPLQSLTTFVAAEGRVFWFSVSPELRQLNYAQIIIQVDRKEDTPEIVDMLQSAVSASIAGAQVEVHQLQTNPVDYPVQIFSPGRRMSPQLRRHRNPHPEKSCRTGAGHPALKPKAASAYNDWGRRARKSGSRSIRIEPTWRA